MSIVNLNNISFSYLVDGKHIKVLDSVNLDIKKGEMIAITGHSGSGKSTLLYVLAGLLKPDSGEIFVNERNISRISNLELASIRNKDFGFVFQQFHLLSKTSVLDNVLMPCHYPIELSDNNLNSKTIEKAKALIEKLGLGDRIDHYPNQLSGGQQQRVAIARALIKDAGIIVADEPTGNLDSKSSHQIMDLLKEINKEGRTVIIVTHDPLIAEQCSKVIHIIDGKISGQHATVNNYLPNNELKTFDVLEQNIIKKLFFSIKLGLKLIPFAYKNLGSHIVRSLLTMLGITVGVAALFTMVTVGMFIKDKILESYATLGINTIIVHGRPDYFVSANAKIPVVFRQFDVDNDIKPLKKIFPEIEFMSPVMYGWRDTVQFAGKSFDQARPLAGNENLFSILDRKFILGSRFTKEHVETNSPVCVLGFEVAEDLFSKINPIGQTILITPRGQNSYNCRILGVMEKISGSEGNVEPNKLVYIPYTYYKASNIEWYGRILDLSISLKQGTDVEVLGRSIETFFKKKYGKSGKFEVDSLSKLISQMKKFLNLFTLMLGAIAIVTMAVGGIGIANMMLVSLSERFKEIGIRKAVGATDFSVRIQFLTESILTCIIAGFFGIIFGFIFYQSVVFVSSKLVPKLSFEWIFEPIAFFMAVVSILLVGVLSGMIPALKAEKLEIVEALRSE